MDSDTINAITALAVAVAGLLGAVGVLIDKLKDARKQVVEQLVESKVAHVDAMARPAVTLSGFEAKKIARRMIEAKLPPSLRPKAADLDALIDRAVATVRAKSDPPGSGE